LYSLAKYEIGPIAQIYYSSFSITCI
jgi:hypothetical protein